MKKLPSPFLWPRHWLHRYMILSNIINVYVSLGINFSDMVSHFLSQLKCSIPVSVCLSGKLRYAVEVLVHAFSSCLKYWIFCPPETLADWTWREGCNNHCILKDGWLFSSGVSYTCQFIDINCWYAWHESPLYWTHQ